MNLDIMKMVNFGIRIENLVTVKKVKKILNLKILL